MCKFSCLYHVSLMSYGILKYEHAYWYNYGHEPSGAKLGGRCMKLKTVHIDF